VKRSPLKTPAVSELAKALLVDYREHHQMPEGARGRVEAELERQPKVIALAVAPVRAGCGQADQSGARRYSLASRMTIAASLAAIAAASILAVASWSGVLSSHDERGDRSQAASHLEPTFGDARIEEPRGRRSPRRSATRATTVEAVDPDEVELAQTPSDIASIGPRIDTHARAQSRLKPRVERRPGSRAKLEPNSVSPATGRLDAERQLIQRAWSALASGDFDDALRWTHRHASQFPEGVLTLERDAVVVLARCRAGRGDPIGLQRAFERDHPRSSYDTAVAQACEPGHTPLKRGTASE
jgi:hypothetical protein